MASSSSFLTIWQNEQVRKTLLSHLDDDSLCNLRLTAKECCLLVTTVLFTRTHLTFTPSALSKPSRLEALARIGHHIQHLTFSMPHTDATFLPPLLSPHNGREVVFLYTPHTSVHPHRPKYGTEELGDVLTRQYPPIFHAATNVPAFIRAMVCMPNLRHLTVSCPGQDPAQRYRRSAVDYALISLRIAIERAHLVRLEKLSMNIHPAGLLYFRHMTGFGCSPGASRRWKQIKRLKLMVDSWNFEQLDQLKIVDDFIRGLSPNLEKVSFTWNGRKGPCPFALGRDPLFAPRKASARLFNEVTSPMSPLPAAPPRPRMNFPKLRHMHLRNSYMSMEQVSEMVRDHTHAREFDFESVNLTNGSWEEALEPLNRMSDTWHQSSDSDYQSCHSQVDDVIVKKKRVRRRRTRPEPHPPQESVLQALRRRLDPEPTLQPTVFEPIKQQLSRLRSHEDVPLEPNIFALGLRRLRSRGFPQIRPTISEPILQAATYVPSAPLRISAPTMETTFQLDPGVQGVQRNLEQDAARQELADDADVRASTLRKAREAVLTRLGTQFKERRVVEQMVPLMIFR